MGIRLLKLRVGPRGRWLRVQGRMGILAIHHDTHPMHRKINQRRLLVVVEEENYSAPPLMAEKFLPFFYSSLFKSWAEVVPLMSVQKDDSKTVVPKVEIKPSFLTEEYKSNIPLFNRSGISALLLLSTPRLLRIRFRRQSIF